MEANRPSQKSLCAEWLTKITALFPALWIECRALFTELLHPDTGQKGRRNRAAFTKKSARRELFWRSRHYFTEQTLLEILRTRTGKLSDVLAVEQEIASGREQIESMQAEKKTLEKHVAFSTVNMRLSEDYRQRVHVVPNSTSTRIRNAAVEGYEMMVAGLINLLLFLVSWGPSILLWGLILFFPARWLWKRRKNDLL